MSEKMLHIRGPRRMTGVSEIVGDRPALNALKNAVDDALQTGAGGTRTFMSDGEPHLVAVILQDDMYAVYTTYANEISPERSKRETLSIEKLLNYSAALGKAQAADRSV